MKTALLRTLTVAAFLLGATLATAPDAQAQLGVAGGANFDRLSDVEAEGDNFGFDNATGYHIGAFYDFAVGPIGVRPGVYYMDVGSLAGEGDVNDDAAIEEENFDLSLVEVPIDLRYRIAFPFVKPYVTAGPVVRFVTDSGGFDDDANDFSMAGNAGLGVDFGLPATSLGFFLEGRYSFGLSPIAEDFEVGDASVAIEDDTRLNNFMLRLGVKF